jgi:expansin (peptidoglycan-binding protein)
MQLAAQETSTVTVKNSEQSNGVVIVNGIQAATGDQAKVSFELHCNKGAAGCKALEAGTYLMVRLPKNWGMYDCANVDLYPASADPAKDQKLGEYCLNER